MEELVAKLTLFKCYTDKDMDKADKGLEYLIDVDAYYKYGIIVKEPIPKYIGDKIKDIYGIYLNKLNQTFHKSFNTVKESDYTKLITDQIVHYFSTYGLESLGIYSKDYVYIPKEQLDIPDLNDDYHMICINKVSEQYITDKLLDLVTTNIPLSNATIKNILCLYKYIPKSKIDDIVNREVKTALYDLYNIVPDNNLEFLKYLVYKLTKQTMIVKNNSLYIDLIHSDKEQAYKYIKCYVDNNGIEELAKIFFRYRKIFMCLKQKTKTAYSKDLNHIINRISTEADRYKQPLKPNLLDNIIVYTRNTHDIQKLTTNLQRKLSNISIFKEISLYNSINNRLNNLEGHAVYKVRNGKTYINEYKHIEKDYKSVNLSIILNTVYEDICNKCRDKIKDKVFYIPEYINYKCPVSEKKFVSNIPEYSTVDVDGESIVVGIHWNNLLIEDQELRVDLDLHLSNDTKSLGWNTLYREDDIYYSGDNTSAPLPNGASEAMYIQNDTEDRFVASVCNYTSGLNKDIPLQLVIAKSTKSAILDNCTFSNIVMQINTEIPVNQNNKTLCTIQCKNDRAQVMFSTDTLANSNVPTKDKSVIKKYMYCLNQNLQYSLNINRLVQDCGGIIYTDKNIMYKMEHVKDDLYKKVDIKPDYDLSPELLDINTIIDIFKN